MEPSQNSSHTMSQSKKAPGTRRVWTRPEEEVLLDALKELVNNGWRADNAFKPGYLGQLLTALLKKFPQTDLTEKHINSKLTVWKKVYSQLSGICGTSGFSFNETTNIIDIEGDVWNTYVKAHPEVEGLKYKNFPFYQDWCIIFGKDRATGNGAQQINDAILDLEHPHHEEEVVYSEHVLHGAKGKKKVNANEKATTVDIDSSDSSDVKSLNRSTATTNENKKKEGKMKRGIKRKSLDGGVVEPLMTMVSGLFEKNNNILASLASKYKTERECEAEKRKAVYDLIEKMVGLPQASRIMAVHKIIRNNENTDLFLNMAEHDRASFIDMVLRNQLG